MRCFGCLEQTKFDINPQAIIERLIEMGTDLARLGIEPETGKYQVLLDRPKRVTIWANKQPLDTCKCHFVHPSSEDLNDSIIEKIGMLSRDGDSVFLMLDDPTRVLDASFISNLSHFPIIGLCISNAQFGDNKGGADIVHQLENLHDLRELIIINPKNLELKFEIIEGQVHINNSALLDSISNLTELRVLIMQNANLFSIPENMGNLKKLRYLDLSHNDIDFISPSIGSLKGLATLNLADNLLQTLPSAIQKLTQLCILILANNFFKNDALKDIPMYLPNLKFLDIQSMVNLETLPIETCAFRKLKTLNISDNPISKLPWQIGDLKALEKLDMTFTRATETPQSLESLKKLRELRLNAGTAMTWNLLIENCEATSKPFEVFFDDLREPLIEWPTERLKAVIEAHNSLRKALDLIKVIEKKDIKTDHLDIAKLKKWADSYSYLTKKSVDGYELCHFIRDPEIDRMQTDLKGILTRLNDAFTGHNSSKC